MRSRSPPLVLGVSALSTDDRWALDRGGPGGGSAAVGGVIVMGFDGYLVELLRTMLGIAGEAKLFVTPMPDIWETDLSRRNLLFCLFASIFLELLLERPVSG